MTVKQVEFTGNTLFSTEALRAALADEMGRSLDLAGLRTMAQRVSALYQAYGYPFARELKSGRVIETGLLTRNLLVLDDQPVVKIHPLARPGQETGTGDLIVTVTSTPTVRFDIGYDNHGARDTRVNRLRPYALFDSPFSLGDQVLLREVYSDENLWLSSLSYGRPIGHLGLYATANASRTSYSLGKDFASLDASGTADTASLSLSYALVRLTTSNSILGTSLQRKQLRDIQCAVRSHERQSIQSLRFSLQFDRRDDLAGRAITYGSVSWTFGNLRLQAQSLTADTSSGVRAFPIGEENADSGAYARVVLRASMGAYSLYAFFDTGRATLSVRKGQLVQPRESVITLQIGRENQMTPSAPVQIRMASKTLHWDDDGKFN